MPLAAAGALIGGLGAVGAGATAATALGVASLGASLGAMGDQKKAASKAASMASNLQYQPIDLNQLQQQAQSVAQQNVAKSIELERQYMPELSAARFGLQKQVASDLERGGMLPLDVANQVTRATMAQAGAGGFGAGPLTAAQLGLTSFDIRQRALERARALTESTPLPVSGLDPGSLASAAIGQNQQMNQFQLSKLGAQTNALQSQAAAGAGLAGGLSGLASIYSNRTPVSTGTTDYLAGSVKPSTSFNFGYNPNYNPFAISNITTSTTLPGVRKTN